MRGSRPFGRVKPCPKGLSARLLRHAGSHGYPPYICAGQGGGGVSSPVPYNFTWCPLVALEVKLLLDPDVDLVV